MALNQAQAEQLVGLIADALPTGQAAHSVQDWILPALVRSRLASADARDLDALLAAADPSSVPALVAGAIAVAGIP